MFGALKLKKCGLDDSQQELYRALFCGSCHAMRVLGGLPATLLTNYDQTFLHLLACAVSSAGVGQAVDYRACSAVPFHRVPVQVIEPEVARTTAAFNTALVEAKLRDDVLDEGGLVKKTLHGAVAGRAREARQLLASQGFDVSLLESLAERQSALETLAQRQGRRQERLQIRGKDSEIFEPQTRVGIKELAEPTAELLAAMFAHLARFGPTHRQALIELGRAMGRYLYVWDAWNDLKTDLRKERFNALLACLGPTPDPGEIRSWLTRELHTMHQALARLDLGVFTALAEQQVRTLHTALDASLPPVLKPAPKLSRGLRRAFAPLQRSPRHVAQRGDCDCAGCDCAGCDCAGCDGCCETLECINCCDSCGVCDDCCDTCSCGNWKGNNGGWCCFLPGAREERKTKKAMSQDEVKKKLEEMKAARHAGDASSSHQESSAGDSPGST